MLVHLYHNLVDHWFQGPRFLAERYQLNHATLSLKEDLSLDFRTIIEKWSDLLRFMFASDNVLLRCDENPIPCPQQTDSHPLDAALLNHPRQLHPLDLISLLLPTTSTSHHDIRDCHEYLVL